jgi:serine protease Do
MREKFIFTISLVAVFFIGVVSTIAVYRFIPEDSKIIEKTVKDVKVTESDTISSSIEKINNAVVYIASTSNKDSSSGTGFFYKKDDTYGYIITNNHVVAGSSKVQITTVAGQTVDATILGADEYSDIAVLRVDKDAVTEIANIGNSTKSVVGDTIFAIGSPLGIDYMNSVSKGIISGTDRTVSVSLSSGDFLMNVLQIDASINPGNSGGPLCNINGEVIGVTSMKLVDSSVEGMGFAIPMEIVMPTVKQLEAGKPVERPYLGVSMLSVNDAWQLYRNGIYLDENIKSGVVVVSVEKDSPVANAGLQKSDVITKIDGTSISTVAELRYLLYKHAVGDTVKVTYIRESKENDVNIVLSKSVGK